MRLLGGRDLLVLRWVRLLLREQPRWLWLRGLVEVVSRLYAPLQLLKLVREPVRVMTLWLGIGQQLELPSLEQP